MPSEACLYNISPTADPIVFVSYSQVEMFSFGCPRRLHGVSASGSRCGSRRAALELCIPSCPTAGQRETIADNRRGDEIISNHLFLILFGSTLASELLGEVGDRGLCPAVGLDT